MYTAGIAASYWRSVRRGSRTLEEVPEALREAVRDCARRDAESGAISREEYRAYTGGEL